MYEENDRDIQKNSKTVRIGLPKGNIYKIQKTSGKIYWEIDWRRCIKNRI